MPENKGLSGKSFLAGAVVGGVLGAVTALLMAPKSGKELRKDITDQYHNVSEKTQQVAGNISQKTQNIAGSISEKTQDIAKGIASTTTEWAGIAKEAAGNVLDDVKSWKEGRKESAVAVEEKTETH